MMGIRSPSNGLSRRLDAPFQAATLPEMQTTTPVRPYHMKLLPRLDGSPPPDDIALHLVPILQLRILAGHLSAILASHPHIIK
ncbi:hypothetical protein MKZ38_008641 [Zalerion maritima]|uniref:Uncharacterized protein n=1 Tax=Zalerion maritima TaxID=339359 RepID=A0AAD5S0J4_9PEZI|nr:hypothetical protein MKZ38_008641 [Zalerion maritima]